jgi:hypothetical protein
MGTTYSTESSPTTNKNGVKSVCYYFFMMIIIYIIISTIMYDSKKMRHYKHKLNLFEEKLTECEIVNKELTLTNNDIQDENEQYREHQTKQQKDHDIIDFKWVNMDSIKMVVHMLKSLRMRPNVIDQEEGGTVSWYGEELAEKTGVLNISIQDSEMNSDFPEIGKGEFLTYTIKKEIPADIYSDLVSSDIKDASFWYDSLSMNLTVRSYRHGNNIALLYTILKFVEESSMDGYVKGSYNKLEKLMDNIKQTSVRDTSIKNDDDKSQTLIQVQEKLNKMSRYIHCSTGNLPTSECETA